ncbi:MAG: glycosyl hydrolase family 18 protein, partial [Leptospiraceae bacterium]|nr:glycosyl hydrolase family 18 protein [Leptospiraceae bacterium]
MGRENNLKDFWKTNTFKITIYAIFWFSLAGLSFWAGVEFIKGNLSFNHIAQKINSIFLKSQESQIITQEEKKEVQTVQAQTQSTEEQKPQETTQENPKEENVSFRASTWFSDYEAMRKNIQYYHEVHPFIYNMKGGLSNDGNIVSSWSKEKRKERVEEMRSLNPNVKIIPTIFRWENPKEKISENIGMNGRNDIREKHIQVILEEIETYGYDGIDIDYEGMTCNKKEKFEEFIVLLSKELKKRGKLLSIAVHPKTPAAKPKLVHCRGLKKPVLQDFAENWRGPMTHDYKFLAKYADRIKIMAYELHPRKYHNPGPGP